MKKIAIFLFEGVELFEIATFTDIFGWNNVVAKKEYRDIALKTISYKKSVTCTWGGELKAQQVINFENINEIYDYDILIIPGGFGKASFFEDKNNEIFKQIIEHFVKENKIIIAVCSAVINLLETGYIKNKKVTTYLLDNKRYFNQLQKYEVSPIENEIVEDGNILTCSGPGNSLTLALLLLEKITSEENRKEVERNMFFNLNIKNMF